MAVVTLLHTIARLLNMSGAVSAHTEVQMAGVL